MPAGVRHWPPFRPKRAAKTAAQGSTAASAAHRFTAPEPRPESLKPNKTVDGCRSLIHTERALRRFAPV